MHSVPGFHFDLKDVGSLLSNYGFEGLNQSSQIKFLYPSSKVEKLLFRMELHTCISD
jgi:hypothetical protein